MNFRDGHNNDITAFLFLINTTRLWFQFKTVIRQNPLWVTKFHDLHLSMAKLEALLTRLPKIIEKMGDEVLKQRKDGAENRSGMNRAGQNKTGRGKKKDRSGRYGMGRDKTGRGKKKDRSGRDGMGRDKTEIRQGRHERTEQKSTYDRITCFFTTSILPFREKNHQSS